MSAAARIAAASLATLVACTTPPSPAPPAPNDACAAACAHRAELGCLEPALAASCAPVCRRASAAGLENPTCIVGAKNVAEMLACDVRCDAGAP